MTRAERAPDTGNYTNSVCKGEEMIEKLKKIGVPCALILDSAVGYTMDKVVIQIVCGYTDIICERVVGGFGTGRSRGRGRERRYYQSDRFLPDGCAS